MERTYENLRFSPISLSEPRLVAADVCKALEISNNRDALNRLDADEKGVSQIDTLVLRDVPIATSVIYRAFLSPT